MTKPKILRFLIFLVPLPFLLAQCLTESGRAADPRGPSYAGAASCASCHKGVYQSYAHTAHFMASSAATDTLVQGSFDKRFNEFVFNPHAKVVMNKTDSGMYQTSYV